MGAMSKQLWAIWIPNPVKAVSRGWREIKGHCRLKCFQIFTYNLAQCSSVDILPFLGGWEWVGTFQVATCCCFHFFDLQVGRFSFQPCIRAFSVFRWWEYLPCRPSSHTAHLAETQPKCKKQCVIITSGFLSFTLLKKPLVSPTMTAAPSLAHVSHFNSLFSRYSDVTQKIYSPVAFIWSCLARQAVFFGGIPIHETYIGKDLSRSTNFHRLELWLWVRMIRFKA